MHIIRLVIFFIKLWKMFLNVVFTLIKFSIEFGLNPALAVGWMDGYLLFAFTCMVLGVHLGHGKYKITRLCATIIRNL